jgi:hypothetical protein
MNFSSLRTLTAIALTALLTACGAGQPETPSMSKTAASVQSDVIPAMGPTSTAAAANVSASAGTAPAIAATGPNMPTPDCAAEACAGLRIIDGNAEAYRLDAMRRAAADGSDQS